MSENWNSYFCNVNDKLASIFVDLGIRKTIPDPSRPWLLWVRVYFKQPRPDGLSSREEFDTLVSIEEKLTTALEQKCGAVLSGRISTDGRRKFYFYGSLPRTFESALAESMTEFHGYRFEYDSQEDPGWRQYLDVLYPSEEDLQRIKNREVLQVLEQRRHVRVSQSCSALGLFSHGS